MKCIWKFYFSSFLFAFVSVSFREDPPFVGPAGTATATKTVHNMDYAMIILVIEACLAKSDNLTTYASHISKSVIQGNFASADLGSPNNDDVAEV